MKILGGRWDELQPMTNAKTETAGDAELPGDGDALKTLLRDTFGFERFRDGQERVCRAVVAGQDLLLVMPTGAGK